MNKLFILLLLVSTTAFGQINVGVMAGQNLTMDKQVVGLSINKPILSSDMSVGVGYMGSIENFDKGTIMANYQTNFFKFSIGGGMGIPIMENKKVFPFLLATYKPFKKQPLRIFVNSSQDRQVVGLVYPLFNTRKK
jgi:hypothetical protein